MDNQHLDTQYLVNQVAPRVAVKAYAVLCQRQGEKEKEQPLAPIAWVGAVAPLADGDGPERPFL